MSPGDEDDDVEITTDTVSKFEHSESFENKEAVRGSGSSNDEGESNSDDHQERG